tara:strand:+ start:2447 stop:2680 length:234 start_codon:yes stop_codon:yes gene_type:complete
MTEIELLKERVNGIVAMEDISVRERVDALLQMDAEMYMELGITSTLRDKSETKEKSVIIYKAIKRLDPRENFVIIDK